MDISTVVCGYLTENCFIVGNADEVLIIDPGSEEAADSIISKVKGRKPLAVLLTHGHFDHIGCVDRICAYYGIDVYMGEADIELLTSPDKNVSLFLTGKELTQNTLPKAISCTNDGILTFGGITVKTIPSAGHSKGSVSYLIDDHLFTGDLMFGGGGYGRVDFYGGSVRQIVASIKNIQRMNGSITVHPGHGGRFLLGNYRY